MEGVCQQLPAYGTQARPLPHAQSHQPASGPSQSHNTRQRSGHVPAAPAHPLPPAAPACRRRPALAAIPPRCTSRPSCRRGSAACTSRSTEHRRPVSGGSRCACPPPAANAVKPLFCGAREPPSSSIPAAQHEPFTRHPHPHSTWPPPASPTGCLRAPPPPAAAAPQAGLAPGPAPGRRAHAHSATSPAGPQQRMRVGHAGDNSLAWPAAPSAWAYT